MQCTCDWLAVDLTTTICFIYLYFILQTCNCLVYIGNKHNSCKVRLYPKGIRILCSLKINCRGWVQFLILPEISSSFWKTAKDPFLLFLYSMKFRVYPVSTHNLIYAIIFNIIMLTCRVL